MATKIVTKNSSTASAVPTASDLVQGELAVNVADKRLFTEDNGGSIVELGTNPSGNITFQDNGKAIFGAGSDLQIYHDGSNSYISDQGTGNLRILGDEVLIANAANNEFKAVFNSNGAASLYYDGSAKLATTSTGIDVTGNVGIGTTSPSQDLEILNGSTGAGIRLAATNTAYWDIERDSTSGHLTFTDDGAGTVLTVGQDGNVGIGTSSPSASKFSSTPNGVLNVSGSKPVVYLTEEDETDSNVWMGLSNEVGIIGNTGDGIAFRTGASTATERLRIDSSGNLLVGKTSANTSAVGVEARENGLLVATRDGGQPLLIDRLTNDGDLVLFRKDSTTVGSIGAKSGDLYIGTGDTALRFLDADDYIYPVSTATGTSRDNAIDLGWSGGRFKDLYLSGGAYLGGTGSANKLDDYEEGTWTPSLVGSTTAGTATFVSGPTGTYTKIGNQVTVYFDWNISAHTGTGALRVNGLPFTKGSAPAVGAVMDGNYSYTSGRTRLVPYVVGSVLRFYGMGDGVGYAENVLDVAHQINGSVTYTV